MPAVTKDKALELLTAEVQEELGVDELLEVYNEVFPEDRCTEEEAHEGHVPLVERLVEHITKLGADEVIDMWGLLFPRHQNVWYDEEDDTVHYHEEAEPVPADG